MWQRFTERARKAVFHAQTEAEKYGEGYVATEHLLLGLVTEEDGLAAQILKAIGVGLSDVRAEVEKNLPTGDPRPGQDMTLTPRCKRVIDFSFDESRRLGHDYIGTEHILLGLLREGDGLAGRVLDKLGVQLEKARAEAVVARAASPFGYESEPPTPQKPPRSYSWKEYEGEAQRAFCLADEMARSGGEPQVAPHHLILALLSQSESTAFQALRKMGFEPSGVHEEINRQRIWAEGAPPIQITANTRLAIDTAYEEAESLGTETIGTGHLLLGLLRAGDNDLGRLLRKLGITPRQLRDAVRELGSDEEGPSETETPTP